VALRAACVALLLVALGLSPARAACSGGVSATIAVTGEVKTPTVFDLDKLRQFPSIEKKVTFSGMRGITSNVYTGALLWDVLNLPPVGGLVVDPSIKNDILRKIIVVTGSDCYESVFGAGEIDPLFGDAQIMLAYAANGKPLASEGFAQLVAPGDKAGGRFVYNIAAIAVKDAGE
jgi:Oxidoreductase molybdopterin binding domain